jgi:hypothetical protein
MELPRGVGGFMARIVWVLLCLLLFCGLAFAGASTDPAGPGIELRQYVTMGIVTIVCAGGGIVLFRKTGRPR